MQFEYQIKYSARKTLSICIDSKNAVIVRAPIGISKQKIESFLLQKQDWILKKLSQNNVLTNTFVDVLRYQSVLIDGRRYSLILTNKNGFEGGVVYAQSLKKLKNIYVQNFADNFTNRVYAMAQNYSLSYQSIGWKSYQSRWGCCDKFGNIIFNYKLLMLPINLQNYVIIHELCHTKYLNHSPDFWRLVLRLLPQAKVYKRQLKNYGFLAKLYL